MNVADGDIANREVAREFVAERQVLLPIALRDLDGVVDVGDGHVLVCDVLDTARATSTLQVS